MIQNHWDGEKKLQEESLTQYEFTSETRREFSSKQPQFIPKGTRERKDKQTPKKLKNKNTRKSEQK